jgi:hypothetical protein
MPVPGVGEMAEKTPAGATVIGGVGETIVTGDVVWPNTRTAVSVESMAVMAVRRKRKKGR